MTWAATCSRTADNLRREKLGRANHSSSIVSGVFIGLIPVNADGAWNHSRSVHGQASDENEAARVAEFSPIMPWVIVA
jgi:hypothetical protein